MDHIYISSLEETVEGTRKRIYGSMHDEFCLKWKRYDPPPGLYRLTVGDANDRITFRLKDWKDDSAGPLALAVPASRAFKTYSPLERPELLTEFAKLGGESNEKVINAFARAYGLTGIGRFSVRELPTGAFLTETQQLFEEQITSGEPIGCRWLIEPLDGIIEAAEELKTLLDIARAVQEKDDKGLKGFVEVAPFMEEEEDQTAFFADILVPQPKIIFTRDGLLSHAKKHLATQINMRLATEVRPYLDVNNEEFLPIFRVRSLAGAVYLHLYWTLVKRANFRRCKRCGSLFIPDRANRETCPPPFGYTKSPCKNRGEARDNYWKERAVKLFGEGVSMEQIAQKSGYSVGQIKSWLKKSKGGK